MSERRSRTHPTRLRVRRFAAGAAAVALSCLALSACDAGSVSSSSGESRPAAKEKKEPVPPVKLASNLGRDAQAVPVDRMVEFRAVNGKLESLAVTSPAGPVAGKLPGNRKAWTATGRLEPGLDYAVRAVTRRTDGKTVTLRSSFHTDDLTLDEQTYPSVAPLGGETVGVGMPVIVSFDVPVTDKASFERHMSVTSSPKQPGAWHWISDNEAHWRPKSYWRSGTDVSVDVDINSIPAGAGIYGQESRRVDFSVGDANVYKVNADTHQMQVFQNGTLLRTIPITTGKPGFTTRSGTKVIVEKFRTKRMNSESIGINRGDDEYYDIDDVEYAMRVTYSGEFVHAAPWSVGSQGAANVSHGCTGMSTANAEWLYNISKRGDVVEYTGTDEYMSLTNGYGDWNLDFSEYAAGSALS